MENPGRKMVVILLLTLAAGAVGTAQKRNQKYQPGQLAAVESEAVIVDDRGITPQSLKRPEGAFLLAIMNRRGDRTEHFSLTLDKDGAPEILSLDTTPTRWRAAVLVDLERGKYRLRLRNSPDLSVPIQIQ